jgi:hypothetical protein
MYKFCLILCLKVVRTPVHEARVERRCRFQLKLILDKLATLIDGLGWNSTINDYA